jgi:hypothetical protein
MPASTFKKRRQSWPQQGKGQVTFESAEKNIQGHKFVFQVPSAYQIHCKQDTKAWKKDHEQTQAGPSRKPQAQAIFNQQFTGKSIPHNCNGCSSKSLSVFIPVDTTVAFLFFF